MICGEPAAVSAGSVQSAVAMPLEFVADGVTAEQPEMPAPLSVKATVPVSPVVPTGLSVMVAVKTTDGDWLTVDGFAEDARARVVLAAPTFSVTGLAVLSLPVKLVSLA